MSTVSASATPIEPRSTEADKTRFVDDRPPEPIDPAHLDMVLQGLEDVRRADFATDEALESIFARFRPR